MRRVTSEAESSESRGRARLGARAAELHRRRLRREALRSAEASVSIQRLEERQLLATLPTPIVTPLPNLTTNRFTSPPQRVDDSSPQIAVNPLDPSNLVAVWNVRVVPPSGPNFYTTQAEQSRNGGQTWAPVGLASVGGELQDPGATPPSPIPSYTRSSDISVAFDVNGNFDILEAIHDDANTAGEIVLSSYNEYSAAASSSRVVYFWNQNNLPSGANSSAYPAAVQPVMAVDANQSNFQDPITGATQNDPNSGTITLAWTRVTPPPPGATNWNPYTVDVVSSNQNFSKDLSTNGDFPDLLANGGPTILTRISGGNGLPAAYEEPTITVSQNAKDPVSGVTIPGGLVTVGFVDSGSSAGAAPPVSDIYVWHGTPNGLGRFNASGTVFVTSTAARGAIPGANFPVASPASTIGISPGIQLAADNTLGDSSRGFGSTQQGRIYLAYTDIPETNRAKFPGVATNPETDESNVYLMVSDNGGRSWQNAASDAFGDPAPVNDDQGTTDGFSGAARPDNGDASKPSGRPQFDPQIAVDQSTGTVLISYYDTRYDAARARVATSIATSIDGGATFGPQTFANVPQTVFDAVAQTTKVIGPIPDNNSSGNPNAESELGYGARMGLAVANGTAFAVWSGNNDGGNDGKQILGIESAQINFAAGPRIIASTMGTVTASNAGGQLYNNTYASDGTQQFTGFLVTFDRPIDASTFFNNLVTITYQPSNGGPVQNIPVAPGLAIAITPTQFLIRTASPQAGIGTYSYSIQPRIRDEVRTVDPTTGNKVTGNLMDQAATGIQGSASYLVPTLGDSTTEPVIVPGLHVIDTNIDGLAQTTDNLALNTTVSNLDVTFDRTVNAATFDATDLLRMVGPNGPISGPEPFPSVPALSATNVGAPIPDGGGQKLDSTITIPSSNGTFRIANLQVLLNINHPRDSDLTVVLISPDGQRVTLVSGLSGPGANFINTTFSDQATKGLSGGVAPYTGTFKPSTALSLFNNKVLDGKWTLEVTDNTPGNAGTLINWTLLATPVLTVTPVPVFEYPSTDVGRTVNPGATSTSTVTVPLNTSGTGGVPVTVASVRLKVNGTLANVSGVLIGPNNVQVPVSFVNGTTIATLPNFDGLTLTTATTWKLQLNGGSFGGTLGSWSLAIEATSDFGTPTAPQTFRLAFPQQTTSGTYTITVGPYIKAQNTPDATSPGDVDANRNAGLDLTRGLNSPGGTITSKTYVPAPLPVAIGAGATVTSKVVVPDNFVIPNVPGGPEPTVTLNLTEPVDANLFIFLTAPDGTQITLFDQSGGGPAGSDQNFGVPGTNQNTVIFDSAGTPIQNAGAPYANANGYDPQTPLDVLQNKVATGTYTLTIVNFGGFAGTLNSWSLILPKGTPGSGLGEPVADQTPVNFRIFTMDPTNPQAANTWTGVGPAGITSTAANKLGVAGSPETGSGVRSSRITGVAIDPSDPTGNTVYVGGASGGVWKTTNFLTTSPAGPSYVPLTDLGSTDSLNIGGIAVFGRNADPNQSMIFVSTGEGDTGSAGVGFLRSSDGGNSWTILDSTTNTDANGNTLAYNSGLRDHLFLGAATYKILVDPRPSPTGGVIVYAAMAGSSTQAGIWQSLDGGNHWKRILTPKSATSGGAGAATDLAFDLNSGTVNAQSNPTGNLLILFAGIQGEGVYISPNQGSVWNLMAGGVGDPLVSDTDRVNQPPVPVTNGPTPNGPNGRIVLAHPALTGNTNQDTQYEGWLYAAVANPDSTFNGLFLTKDFGQNWVKVLLPTIQGTAAGAAVPTNDNTQPGYGVTGAGNFGQGNYDLSLVVDAINPQVVYLGGSADGEASSLVRVDVSFIQDSKSFFLSSQNPDGGLRRTFTTNPIGIKNPVTPKGQVGTFTGNGPVNIYTPLAQSLLDFSQTTFGVTNLLRDPNDPFITSTIYTLDATTFTNGGQGARWIPFDAAIDFSTDQHRALSIVDPLTGKSRMIFTDDQGIWSAIDSGNGQLLTNIGGSGQQAGNVALPDVDRNGNLQINQIYYGASQPTVADGLKAQLASLFYFTLQDNGFPQSDPNILSNGDLVYYGPGGDGGGVGVDQTGKDGNVYDYRWPCCGGNSTNFFTAITPSNAAPEGLGRTFGLLQQSQQGKVPDPQWPFAAVLNFAVNPIEGNDVIIGSAGTDYGVPAGQGGNIFGTTNGGQFWSLIGSNTVFDGTTSLAMAYGAPDPSAPGYTGQLNAFLYVGTNGGHIYMTRTGGGQAGIGNQWLNISTGLDGSQIHAIYTNPTRGSGEAWAVTTTGVFWMPDSRVANPRWSNITGNLFSIQKTFFSSLDNSTTVLHGLTSVQVDYRYAIPDNPAVQNGPTHPVLYVGGDGGVYRSFDKGKTWELFPEVDVLGAPAPGSGLPNLLVSDLKLVGGEVQLSNGLPVATGSGTNVLLASTYGRGAFAIRLAPIIFNSGANAITIGQSSPGTGGTTVVTTNTPSFSGFSQLSGPADTTTVQLIDLTGVDLTNATAVQQAELTKVIGQGVTDGTGKFTVTVNKGVITANGIKVIGVQAVDASGTRGNIVPLTIQVQVANQGGGGGGGTTTPPTTPTITLLASEVNGPPNSNLTRTTRPILTGHTDPFVTVQIYNNNTSSAKLIATGTADGNGNYAIPIAAPPAAALKDGQYIYYAIASSGALFSSYSNPLLLTIDTTPPAVPTLMLLPSDVVGSNQPNQTTLRRPHLVGKTDPYSTVQILQAGTNALLATSFSDANGNYSAQLPFDLSNGTIQIVANAKDIAGNISAASSPTFTLTIAGVQGDYNGDGKADLAIYWPSAPYSHIGIASPQPGSPLLSFQQFGIGGTNHNVPIQGDFDGDGKTDVAVFDPTTANWYIQESKNGFVSVHWGNPGDIPVPADYDGDGVSDFAVFRPSTGEWFIAGSKVGFQYFKYGTQGDVPVPGNYDNVGHAEVAIYRPSTAQWFIEGSAKNFFYGGGGDIPVPADYDGDGVTDVAVYRPSNQTFYALYSSGQFGGGTQVRLTTDPSAVPVSEDFNGDGLADFSVFLPSSATWLIDQSANRTPQAGGVAQYIFNVGNRDIAIPGPYAYRLLSQAGAPVVTSAYAGGATYGGSTATTGGMTGASITPAVAAAPASSGAASGAADLSPTFAPDSTPATASASSSTSTSTAASSSTATSGSASTAQASTVAVPGLGSKRLIHTARDHHAPLPTGPAGQHRSSQKPTKIRNHLALLMGHLGR